MKRVFFIVALFLNILVGYSQNNILNEFNGDFENGVDYWRFFENPSDNGSFAELTTDAVSGDYAMKINFSPDYGNIIDRGFDNWSARVPVKARVVYTLKAFVRGSKNSLEQYVKVRFTIGFFDASGNVISQRDKYVAVNDTYSEGEFNAEAPDNAASCWVAFRLKDAMHPCSIRNMYIDNVRLLEPYPESINSLKANELIELSNYPNPFKSETVIKYNTDVSGIVTLKVYDMLGQEIAVLVKNQYIKEGIHKINWVPNGITNGMYNYRLELLTTNGLILVANSKMVLSNQ